MKKLFLLDAFALIYRADFAFARNPRVTSKGLDTSAVYGFLLALLDVIEKEKPSHLAVVFDIGGSQAREQLYPEYKAHRDETPEGIKVAVPYIQKLLAAMRIPALGLPGYEADDVIGTLAHQAESAGFEVFMMTPDKDFGQLVTEQVKMYKPARGGEPAEVLGPLEVCQKWGIDRVDQVIDLLGLMGDAVDNIPGIPGVGEKTAAKLLAEYGTLENVLAHGDQISGKLGERVREHSEQARLSRVLATIITDAPIALDEADLVRELADGEALRALLDELEIRSLARRLLPAASAAIEPEAKTAAAAAPPRPAAGDSAQMDLFGGGGEAAEAAALQALGGSAATQAHAYTLIDTVEAARALARSLDGLSEIAFDTETTGLDALEAEMVGFSLSWEAHTAYYVALPSERSEAQTWLEFFRPHFERIDATWIGHNLKFDLQILANYGINLVGTLRDTMLAHYLIEPDQRHGMDALAQNYLGYRPISIDSLIGAKGKNQKSMRDLPASEVAEYAAEDADVTWRLHEAFKPKLAEAGLERVLHDLEAPLIPVLAGMERAGMAIDLEGLARYSAELAIDSARLESEVRELAGVDFNLGSPKQLGEVLFDRLKLDPKAKKTKTGQYATGEEVLENFRKAHPIVDKLLEWRQVGKLKSTYVDALPELVNPRTGRIHTTFNQAVAATGRLSSTNPNMQNIPVRSERGQRVRDLFVAGGPDRVLLSADYSQIELRVIASMSGDSGMIDAFLSGEDIHAATASKVFGVPLAEVSREQRSQAKTVNFGIIYGVSAFGLSQQTNLSRSEAKEVIEQYFATYPGIKKYIDDQVAAARAQGYVETLLGRRRYLRDIDSRNQAVRGHSERNAINAPIQGTAADIVKLAMIRIHGRLQREGLKSPMILQVHDELVFDAYSTEVESLRELVKAEMESAFVLKVPLVADTGVGCTWLQAH
jgi:DNA polymerase-1